MDISELSKRMVCWDYEAALKKFFERRKMDMKITPVDGRYYDNACIKINYTTDEKLECVFRWMREGDNSKRYIIMINKTNGWTKNCSDLDCEELIKIVHNNQYAAIEVWAVRADDGKHPEED